MTIVEELRAKVSRDNRELLDRAADEIEDLDRNLAAAYKRIEELMKRHIFPVAREGVIEIEREPFLVIDPQDWEVLKNKYIYGRPWAAPIHTIPTIPTGDDKGGNFA